MKSHIGIFMTIGKAGMYTSSCKQKLNTKSSTEVELVAIDDAMVQILWTRHFLAAQGVPVPVTTIYQDNKVPSCYQKMGRHPVANVPNIWTYSVSLLQTASSKERLKLHTALQKIC